MKLFILIPDDLRASDRMPQAIHAALEHAYKLMNISPNEWMVRVAFINWMTRLKTVVVHRIDSDAFYQVVDWQRKHLNDATVWTEPDLGDEPTAIAMGPTNEETMVSWVREATGQESPDLRLA